jgi:serine/threonine protein kinase
MICHQVNFIDINFHDYKMGLPAEHDRRVEFIQKLEDIVSKLHDQCHVVHYDLYLSNILYKINDSGELELKLIDFDTAMFDYEDATSATMERLRMYGEYRIRLAESYGKKQNRNRENRDFDLSLIDVIIRNYRLGSL